MSVACLFRSLELGDAEHRCDGDYEDTIESPALLERQLERKTRLQKELRREKGKLRSMQRAVRDMEKDMAQRQLLKRSNAALPHLSTVLQRVQHLRQEIHVLTEECKRMTMEVDMNSDSRVPLGETDEEFYKNIYTGQQGPVSLQSPTPSQNRGEPSTRLPTRPAPPPPAPPPPPPPPDDSDSPEGQSWTCSECTFRNYWGMEYCEQCEMPRMPLLGTLTVPSCYCHPRPAPAPTPAPITSTSHTTSTSRTLSTSSAPVRVAPPRPPPPRLRPEYRSLPPPLQPEVVAYPTVVPPAAHMR